MSNTISMFNGIIFDPAIHASDANGQPILRKDGSFAMKRGRKPGTPNTGTGTRGGFDVEAVTGAYLARIMAAGDLNAITAFTAMTKGQRVQFLIATPEYQSTVGEKIVTDAAAKIDAILDAAGEEYYHAIMARVRTGA